MKDVCDAILDDLSSSASALGTPGAVIAEARDATVSRFAGGDAGGHRVSSYFWGVVRQRALRGRAPMVGALLVMDSMWNDMAEAGHLPESIVREMRSTFGESGFRRYAAAAEIGVMAA